ncbi:MAG: hypothetical protein U0228_01585 [Myxococcaceae bacterium]
MKLAIALATTVLVTACSSAPCIATCASDPDCVSGQRCVRTACASGGTATVCQLSDGGTP